MDIYLYNTLTKKKEKFQPLRKGKVGFYLCGPTVYDYFHIGNARTFVVFDIIRRYLEFAGYKVTYLVNLTDVDDRLINKAREEKTTVKEIAEKYTEAYFEDIEKLGIKKASINPRATEHIPEMITIVEKLIKNGYAYKVKNDVFFNVLKFSGYGKLSGKKIDELLAGARVDVQEDKKNPLDFALWKGYKKGEIFWDTPFGKGRPGWHLECSAMSMKYLGNSIDIHAGAEDLVFPHHENEVAQSECATGKGFVKYWMHSRFLKIKEEKMSKSLGNDYAAREIIEEFGKESVRFFFLQKHYRNPMDFDFQLLKESQKAVNRIGNSYKRIKDALKGENVKSITNPRIENLREEITMAMNDDFNTAVAVSKFFDIFRLTNRLIEKEFRDVENKGILKRAEEVIDEFNSIFDILPVIKAEDDLEGEKLIKLLIDLRNQLRSKKEWGLADKIRNDLMNMRIELEDGKSGTNWKRI